MANDSEINRFPLFVLLRVTEVSASEWAPDATEPAQERRTVQLRGEVTEVLKGDGSPGEVSLSVTQRQALNGRISGDEGPWSAIDLDARPPLVLGAASAEDLGSDDALVIAADDPARPHAAADVRKAVELSRGPDLVARVRSRDGVRALVAELAESGPLLARYFIDVLPTLALPRLLRAGVAPQLRATLLTHLVQEVSLREAPADPLRLAVARRMFNVLREPGDTAAALKDLIAGVYLKNTLFDMSGRPYVQLAQLYPDAERRRVALAGLQNQRFGADQQRLFASWRRGGGPTVA